MTERLGRDVALLRGRYPDAQFREEGLWIFLPRYVVPSGWKRKEYAISFQIRPGYPDISPYGINVSPPPEREDDAPLTNYVQGPDPKPPFDGNWGRFSWEIPDWKAMPDIVSGSTLVNYVESIRHRFAEGA